MNLPEIELKNDDKASEIIEEKLIPSEVEIIIE